MAVTGNNDMARPTLDRHRKFKRLARLLGSRPLARGYLELLWDCANESGDPVFPDARDVEAVCEWDGVEGDLCKMLVEVGFLEQDNSLQDLRYIIHDFWHHCPEYVRRRRVRELERKELDIPDTGNSDQSVTSHCPVSDQSVTSQCPTNDSTPTPTPAPIHTTKPLRPPLTPPLGGTSPVADPQLHLEGIPDPAPKPAPPPKPRNPRQRNNGYDGPIPHEEIMAYWNNMAGRWGLPEMKEWTPKRKEALRRVFAREWWRENWQYGIDVIPTIPFLTGTNSRDWKANIDYFLRADSLNKILEGQYGRPNEYDPTLDESPI